MSPVNSVSSLLNNSKSCFLRRESTDSKLTAVCAELLDQGCVCSVTRPGMSPPAPSWATRLSTGAPYTPTLPPVRLSQSSHFHVSAVEALHLYPLSTPGADCWTAHRACPCRKHHTDSLHQQHSGAEGGCCVWGDQHRQHHELHLHHQQSLPGWGCRWAAQLWLLSAAGSKHNQ